MKLNNKTVWGTKMARIYCPHCKQKLFIQTSKQVIDSVRDVYGDCHNDACLARPIMRISHIGDRQPPISKPMNTATQIEDALKDLSNEERQLLLKKFS
jgi:hypothetical protein